MRVMFPPTSVTLFDSCTSGAESTRALAVIPNMVVSGCIQNSSCSVAGDTGMQGSSWYLCSEYRISDEGLIVTVLETTVRSHFWFFFPNSLSNFPTRRQQIHF